MLEINMQDVYTIIGTCKPYLIVIAAALVLAVIVTVAVSRMKKPLRKLVRTESWIAALLVVVLMANLICYGPMKTILTLTGTSGSLDEQTAADAIALGEEIEAEGIVLLKNDGFLPAGIDSINLFGWASVFPSFGGTGSGSMSEVYPTVSLIQGIENAGIKVNSELSDFYMAYRSERPKLAAFKQDWTLPEPPAETYTDTLISNAKAFSDTAMIVISRSGGENFDLPHDMSAVTYSSNSESYDEYEADSHYLQLTRTEQDLVELVCSSFSNVILLYNGSNTLELGFVEKYPEIRSVLWCAGAGVSGFNALGKILKGEVNPSAKTTDTFVYDLTKTPYFNNIGSFVYDNLEEFVFKSSMGKNTPPTFVNYVESIYVGYRFFETAAAEGLIDYEETVQFPFGYGLSYTTFSQEMGELKRSGDIYTVKIKVTNTGSIAGKEVVELYFTPPYTNGGIEKSEVNLLAFGKTALLKPGASETIELSFKLENLASYDSKNNGCYVLEKGEYSVSLRSDSHTVIDRKIITVDSNVVYNEKNKRSTDDTAAINRFDDAYGDVTYLSRADGFSNYEVATAAPTDYSMHERYKSTLVTNANYVAEDYDNPDDIMPVMGANNGLKLADLAGVAYTDEKWDSLLDQLTYEEMNILIGRDGYQTPEIPGIEKPATVDVDGPKSITNNFSGASSVGFPGGVTIACTWNKELALRFGEMMGKMADMLDVTGWYAPAMNLHRSAFGGRNFEYYSEDGLLSGVTAAETVKGAQKYGVYCYIKHFALNEQDTNRVNMLCTWADEQAIREIYLKPFEIAVKDGEAHACMSSMNLIGIVSTAAHDALLNKVLRDEWGFHGMVITDTFSGKGQYIADRMVRNGNDALLTNFDNGFNFVTDESATAVIAMRAAAKNILYTVANSRVYGGGSAHNETAAWEKMLTGVDITAGVLAAAVTLLAVISYFRTKKQLN